MHVDSFDIYVFQTSTGARSPFPRGFLGLSVTFEEALQTASVLRRDHHSCLVLHTNYRTPKIDEYQGHRIAEHVAQKLIATKYPDVHNFGPLVPRSLHPAYWAFGRFSPQLDAEGAGIYVNIDKVDGHVWEYDELYRLMHAQGLAQ